MKNMHKIYFFILLITSLYISCKSSDSTLITLDKIEKAGSFSISSEKKAIILNGEITESSFNDFKKTENAYQDIKQINIVSCNGSNDDQVNLTLSKYLHDQSFNIHLNDNGQIASGGTDLFVSGITRTKGSNTKIGVHSWSDSSGLEGTDYPRGHQEHLFYIDYYKYVGFSQKNAEDFYYFTIYSAPANNIHWMTEEEIEKYGILKNK